MERRRIIIVLTLIATIILSACGSVGTETGNPEQVPEANAGAPEKTDVAHYDNNGITLDYSNDWNYHDGAPAASPAPSIEEPADDEELYQIVDENIVVFLSGDSSVTIHIETLNKEPPSLEAYLGAIRPEAEFDEFENPYMSGLAINDSDPQEIYFLEGNNILYIIVELSEGSGSTEAEVILQSIRFAE